MDLYSFNPFYLNVCGDGLSHGVLILNIHDIEVIHNKESLKYKVRGGFSYLYIFPNPIPLDVIDQYIQLIGRPIVQPFLSFKCLFIWNQFKLIYFIFKVFFNLFYIFNFQCCMLLL